jgi:DNA-directed RNA polymerase subunit RPC12/RpoP
MTKDRMYQDNIIAVKHVTDKRRYDSQEGDLKDDISISKPIERIQYLKICWNCGKAYESKRYDSYACKPKCRYNLIYKLKKGIKPPVRMQLHMKAKNMDRLKELFEYL